MPLTAETRRTLSENDDKWPVKLILRAVATFLAFLGMILLAVATSSANQNFIDENDWTDGMTLAPIIISLIYNPIVIALLLFVRRGRAIHPGWHVAVDLIIWGLCVPSVIFSVAGGSFWSWTPTLYNDDGTVTCDFEDGYNEYAKPCLPVLYTIGGTEIAGIVFLFLIFVLHVTLFVFACIDTKKWRRAAKMAKSERHNFELQYHRSPEEHLANQPPAYTPSAEGSDAMAGSAVKYA